MKNRYLVFLIITLVYKPIYTQNMYSIPSVVALLQTTNLQLQDYYKYVSSLNEQEFSNIEKAYSYYIDTFANAKQETRDSASLILQKYYLSCNDIYLDANKEPIRYSEVLSEKRDEMELPLNKFGFTLGKASEGGYLYFYPLVGYLTKTLDSLVSNEYKEYFSLYDLKIEAGYLLNNDGNSEDYLVLIQEIIIGIEHFQKEHQNSVFTDFLNAEYCFCLYQYLTLNHIFGVFPNVETNELQKIKQLSIDFENKYPESETIRFIKNTRNLLPDISKNEDILSNFMYTTEYNEFNIPEIRKDLCVNNINALFEDFMNNQ